MSSVFFERPARFFPAFALALGAAAGFYPSFLSAELRLAATLLILSFGSALGALAQRQARLRALLLFCFGAGLALGTCIDRELAAGSRLGPALSALQALSPARPGHGPAEALPLELESRGAAGRLSQDSRQLRSGYVFSTLEAERLFLGRAGLEGWCSTEGRLGLFVRGTGSWAAGSRLEARGRFSLGEGEPALFADEASLVLRKEASSLAEWRSTLRGAFLEALSRIAVVGPSTRAGAGESVAGRPKDGAPGEGLLLALLAGFRDELSPSDAAAFTEAGCAHILALSGQHLAILASAFALLFKPLVGKRGAGLASLLLAAFYVFVVGPGPSLLRALLMYGLSALFLLADRPQAGRAILGLAFVLQLLIDPASARSLGFQLSYLAVAGLVILAPRFEHLLLPGLPPLLAKAFAASLAAQAATAPLVAWEFGVFQPVGVLTSVIASPLVACIMWWGLGAALLASFLPGLGLLVSPLTLALCGALSACMAFFADLPALELPNPALRSLLGLAVVGLAAFVYARPHAEYLAFGKPSPPARSWRPAGLRFPERPQGPPRSGGARHVQALRPEFPRQPERAGADPG